MVFTLVEWKKRDLFLEYAVRIYKRMTPAILLLFKKIMPLLIIDSLFKNTNKKVAHMSFRYMSYLGFYECVICSWLNSLWPIDSTL